MNLVVFPSFHDAVRKDSFSKSVQRGGVQSTQSNDLREEEQICSQEISSTKMIPKALMNVDSYMPNCSSDLRCALPHHLITNQSIIIAENIMRPLENHLRKQHTDLTVQVWTKSFFVSPSSVWTNSHFYRPPSLNSAAGESAACTLNPVTGSCETAPWQLPW